MNQTLRDLLQSTPRLDGEADADYDARVAGLYPAFVRTPRTTPVTLATLASGAVWGRARATAVLKDLRQAAAADPPVPALSDEAALAVALLDGPGFDPTDPESVAAVAAFVAAPLISQDEADRVLYVYPAPADCPAPADVTANRVAADAERAIADRLAAGEAWQAEQSAAWNAMDADYAAWRQAVAGGEVDAPLPKGVVREA